MNITYKNVASKACVSREDATQVAQQAIIHVARVGAQTTLCGTLKAADAVDVSRKRVISCMTCRTRLNLEVQARVSAQQAGYEHVGNDTVMVPVEEIDRLLVKTLSMRAAWLRCEGFDSLAADLEIAAGRLAEHTPISDNTSVPQAPGDALSADSECPICADTGRAYGNYCTCKAGQAQRPERRLRPRAITPTTTEGDDL